MLYELYTVPSLLYLLIRNDGRTLIAEDSTNWGRGFIYAFDVYDLANLYCTRNIWYWKKHRRRRDLFADDAQMSRISPPESKLIIFIMALYILVFQPPKKSCKLIIKTWVLCYTTYGARERRHSSTFVVGKMRRHRCQLDGIQIKGGGGK